MTEWVIARCRDCGAPVVWTLTTANQRRMPVDAEPVEDGNVVLTSGNSGPEARVLTRAELDRRATRTGLYRSHFSTCPNAAGRRQR